MTTFRGFTPVFRAREMPLPAAAVAARGGSAQMLARRALTRNDEDLGRLRGVAGDGLLVLLGVTEDLPWCEGGIYLGIDPRMPSLLVPTTMGLCLEGALEAPALLERALAQKLGDGAPWAVLPPLSIVPLANARAVARPLLERLAREQHPVVGR